MQDVFELQRNLNNAFAYDLVPSPSVCTAALRAARRVNDFPTAVRIFEGMLRLNRGLHDHLRTTPALEWYLADDCFFFFLGIRAKVENRGQYHEYLRDLQPIREELGVSLKEDMYPEATYRWEKNK